MAKVHPALRAAMSLILICMMVWGLVPIQAVAQVVKATSHSSNESKETDLLIDSKSYERQMVQQEDASNDLGMDVDEQTSEPKISVGMDGAIDLSGAQDQESGRLDDAGDNTEWSDELCTMEDVATLQLGAQSNGEDRLLSAQDTFDGTIEAFLEVVNDQPYGGNKYNKYNNYSGSDYCAQFVMWCAKTAGLSSEFIPQDTRCANVGVMRDSFFDPRGLYTDYTYEPKAGDLVFYSSTNQRYNLSHVGVVTGVQDGKVYTKEGNTSYGGTSGSVGSKVFSLGTNRISGGWYVVAYGINNAPHRSSVKTNPDWSKFGPDANLPSGDYTIRPVLDTRKYLEIAGGGTGDGDNVQIWTHSWPGECGHIKWHLSRLGDGSYGVNTFAGKTLDVSGGLRDDGANAQQWTWTDVDQQHWYIHDCGNGTYALEAKHSGKFLDLAGGGTGDGNNVCQWSWINNDNKAQKWVITPCNLFGDKREVDDGWWYIRSAVNPHYVMDIAGSGSADGDNLQLWEWSKSQKQRFRFIRSDNDETYRIETASGKVLDIANGSRSYGADVRQWSYSGVDQQRWWIQDAGDGRVAIQSKQSGLYLDVTGGVTENGGNIQQWFKGEGDIAKWWYLTPVDEGKVASIPNGTYEIVSAIDGKSVIDATSFEGGDDCAALAAANGSLRQRFLLTGNADGSIRIKNLANDSYLDVSSASPAMGTYNNFWSDTDTSQQHWYVEDAGSGMYSFRNKWTNWYLDVKGGKTEQGTMLHMWDGNGTNSQRFSLRRLTLDDVVVDAVPNQVYTGSAITPGLTVRFFGRVLAKGVDYSVSYASNVETGTAMATVTGINGFEGSKRIAFNISKANLSHATLSAIPNQPYTGSPIKPEPSVTLGGKTLTKGLDYALSWSNNSNVGTATVTVSGKGKYTGSKSVEFSIAKAASKVSLASQTKTYNGEAQGYSGKVTRSGSAGNVTYKYYSDANCTKVIKASNIKDAGTYYVRATIASDATHAGKTSAPARFVIAKAKNPIAAKAVARTASLKTLKSKAVIVAAPLSVSKMQGTVSYAKAAKGSSAALTVNKTTGKVTVKKGTKKGTYTIRIKVTAGGNANYEAGSKTVACKIIVK